MADDIMKALSDSYNRVADDAYLTDAGTLESIFGEKIDLLSSKMMKYYDEEEKRIDAIKQAEVRRFETLFKNEMKYEKYSQKVKADLLQQENQHYTELYNLKKDLHKKEVTLLEDERKIRQQIAQSGKVTLGDLASLYTKHRQIAELEKETLEYKEEQFKKGVDTVKNAFKTIIQHVMNYVNERDNLLRWNQWESGIKNLGSVYEERFTEIAARNGSNTQMETHSMLKGALTSVMNSSILSKGLNFNSEVFPAISEAIQKGFTGQEATEIGLSNAIDKKLMPWLDTQSETWVQMQFNMSDEALLRYKSDQLMLQATQEGNRLLQSGVISQITDSILPSLDNIVANTTEVEDLNDEMYAKAMYLMNDMGYSKADAIKAVNKEVEAYQNPFKALTSGDTGDRLLALDNLFGTDLVGNFASSLIGSGWAGTGAFFNLTGLASGGETRTERGLLAYSGMEDAQEKYIKQYNLSGDNSSQYNINKLLEYTTATQQNDNLKQNTAAEYVFDRNLVAHGIDLAALQLNELKELKTWLITGLSVLLLTKLTDKLTDGFISKFMSKIKGGGTSSSNSSSGLGKIGSGITSAFTKGGTALSGGKLSGTGAATLGGAFTVGGLAALGYGGYQAFNEYSQIGNATNTNKEDTDHAVSGTLAATGAVGGGMMAAAGLGLASGPVGWIGLAVAGVGLLGKTIYDTVTKIGGAGDAIEAEYAAQKESIRQSTQSNIDNLTGILGILQDTTSTEADISAQRNALMSSGLLTEHDMNVAKTANKEQLEELTKAYLKSTNDFSGEIQTALDEYTVSSKAWSQDAWGEMEEMLQKYNDSEDGKSRNDAGYIEAAGMIMNTIYSDLEKQKQNGVELDKSSNKIYEAIGAVMSGGYTADELNSIIDSGWFNEHLQSMKVSSPETIMRISTQMSALDTQAANDIYYAMQNNNRYYDAGETADALTYLINAKNSVNKENATEYLNEFKEAGYKLSNYPTQKTQLTDKWGSVIDLSGYKLGSTYIPYDQLAMVHAGERVLTEGQNKKYTEELVSGNSSSSIIQAGVQDIVMAIKNQTSEIINYLSTMSFNNSSFGNSQLNMLPAMGNTKVTI